MTGVKPVTPVCTPPVLALLAALHLPVLVPLPEEYGYWPSVSIIPFMSVAISTTPSEGRPPMLHVFLPSLVQSTSSCSEKLQHLVSGWQGGAALVNRIYILTFIEYDMIYDI